MLNILLVLPSLPLYFQQHIIVSIFLDVFTRVETRLGLKVKKHSENTWLNVDSQHGEKI